MKKLTKAEYLKQQEDFYEEHVRFHTANAFCGTAGEAEMQHIGELLTKLTDTELEELVTKGGIYFNNGSFDRDAYEAVVDEVDREKFYKIYNELLAARK